MLSSGVSLPSPLDSFCTSVSLADSPSELVFCFLLSLWTLNLWTVVSRVPCQPSTLRWRPQLPRCCVRYLMWWRPPTEEMDYDTL
ncbi:hypothetical protein J4Q44_G00387030 [Coregonus suidteri]|uniref:Uncharacterized protein n=1 Tax=Coregonus suidteri TaxID=861788 RepID=A0AAN8KEI8_9TELE